MQVQRKMKTDVQSSMNTREFSPKRKVRTRANPSSHSATTELLHSFPQPPPCPPCPPCDVFLRRRKCVTLSFLVCIPFLLCQCDRQPPTSLPTPTATPTPVPTTSVTATPTAAPQPSTTPLPLSSADSTPDKFGDGIKRLLEASDKGFIELHGKLKRTENGSGPEPLFRLRKIYEGTFLFGGAALAELEEVYFTAGPQPAYNYHLYYQALSVRASIEKYDDFRQNLNRVLEGFKHTFGDRYDAWARDDVHKTAVLLSSQESTGSPEIQVHVAFSTPQW
jgi:hypothetical protein